MEQTIALASVYELQGLKSQALEVYNSVLEKEPTNAEALSGVKRLSQPSAQLREYAPLQRFEVQKMQKLFIQAESLEELQAIEKWLLEWN
ncbi:hypothetical protein [Helicobacter felis]|uniref:Tetratricopeptide repeat protein n=1 Tax=Helicobacter felis (strain ATCC 49179 / CCUG 28539 / NCTC 12436 / CS1) TaxID=936155 RepID=E7ACD1_HELFC|nr:hypothetical protein [Helicobacter felis]CBY83018.1 Putative hypothetical protein [Helicobacter felis ATCC 49179]